MVRGAGGVAWCVVREEGGMRLAGYWLRAQECEVCEAWEEWDVGLTPRVSGHATRNTQHMRLTTDN